MQSLCTRYESTAAMHLPHQNVDISVVSSIALGYEFDADAGRWDCSRCR